MNALQVPVKDRCAFCDYLTRARPFVIADLARQTAVLVTLEQRGIGHVLVIPTAHRPTLLDLQADEAIAVMAKIVEVAKAIEAAYAAPGIAVWQNNGLPAHQTIPHVHFHVAGTLPQGGTEFGEVPELSMGEALKIADKLGPFLGLASK